MSERSDGRPMRVAAVRVPVSTVWAGPDAPREVDAPAVADVPDVAAWCDAMDGDVRLGLHGRTLTQALYGEPVVVLAERDGWAEVVALWQPSSAHELGYPGWLPASHLGELPTAATDPVAVIAGTAGLSAEPGGEPLAVLSFGTVLPSIEAAGGATRVALPDGGTGWLPDDAIRPAGAPSTSEDRLRLAGQFLGLTYLWGGTSSYGLDCSGLVHAVTRVLGARIPRDAHDQQALLPAVEPDQAAVGDLYFFGRPGQVVHHVGFVSPTGMLHASETGKVLEDGSLGPDRLETLVGAARLDGID